MIPAGQDMQKLDHQPAADAVIPRLAHIGLGVGQNRELTDRNDRIAKPHAGLGHFLCRAGPDVDVHLPLLYQLAALVLGQQMGRFRADNADHISTVRLDDHALRQHHLIPPATKGNELDEAFLGDVAHHEANLVHVRGHQHTGS